MKILIEAGLPAGVIFMHSSADMRLCAINIIKGGFEYQGQRAEKVLRFAAGNFYINDKPTGAVVGRQPFGGARNSETNDKAGSWLNILKWLSPRNIKETTTFPTDWKRAFLDN